MSSKHFATCCDDPECVFCQDDDADAAFWDEFFYHMDDEAHLDDAQKLLLDEQAFEEDFVEDEDIISYTPEIIIED